MKMTLFAFTILLLGLLPLLSAEQVPFSQCVEILNIDVDNITCYFTQGSKYVNESMSPDGLSNEFCFEITDTTYPGGTYSYSIWCNDSSNSATLTDNLVIDKIDYGPGSLAPMTMLSKEAGWYEELQGYMEEDRFDLFIFGFIILIIFMFTFFSTRRAKNEF